jgi:hypothetical protein
MCNPNVYHRLTLHSSCTQDALMCTFILLEGEGWNGIMFSHYRATRAVYGAFSPVYFLIVYLLCNIFLLNLFVAILLANFTQVWVVRIHTR